MSKHRIFVTGATGYLGSAIASRLVRGGHDVTGLTRDERSARALETAGIKAVVGDFADAEGWVGVLQNCDSVVHAAFDASTGSSEQDHLALEAFRVAALDGRLRRVLYTSGSWVMGPSDGQLLDETAPAQPLEISQWRAAHEEIAIDLSTHEVAAIVLRPGNVYGEARGILGGWFADAQATGRVNYPGDGSQHWAMVHRDDVAEAYALALEHGRSGERYLLCDESHYTVKQLAEAAAAAAGATAVATPTEDVVKALGVFGKALLNDALYTSAKARRELGWVPRHSSFVNEAPELWREWNEARAAAVA